MKNAVLTILYALGLQICKTTYSKILKEMYQRVRGCVSVVHGWFPFPDFKIIYNYTVLDWKMDRSKSAEM